ncbi:hypothetical protein DFH07DRAFT_752376 [Mycena maculata]|uniref:RRM domain-containing protein n=1 Tax=Mycena maculata TaxID=230809 RepID=A0AAD7IAT1_9AGAR|nr:hypothetical protein DFH07DRAFT_752376 [Mycena maculata]
MGAEGEGGGEGAGAGALRGRASGGEWCFHFFTFLRWGRVFVLVALFYPVPSSSTCLPFLSCPLLRIRGVDRASPPCSRSRPSHRLVCLLRCFIGFNFQSHLGSLTSGPRLGPLPCPSAPLALPTPSLLFLSPTCAPPNSYSSHNPGNNLHVSGLSHKIDTRDLEAAFAKIGRVKKASVMYDPHTRESRGFGFVTMESAEEADAAVAALHGTDMGGKAINVEKVHGGF